MGKKARKLDRGEGKGKEKKGKDREKMCDDIYLLDCKPFSLHRSCPLLHYQHASSVYPTL